MRAQLLVIVVAMTAVPAPTAAQTHSRGSAVTGGLPPIGLPLPRIGLPLPPIGLPREVSPQGKVAPPAGRPHHPPSPIVWYFVPVYPWYSGHPAPSSVVREGETDSRGYDRHKRRKRDRRADVRDHYPREIEPRAPASAEPAPVQDPAPPVAPPPSPQPVYFIPGCYLGNIPPKDAKLPETCDLSKVTVFEP